MVSNSDLAHKFANGATHGTGSHMFIEDNTIYSYGHHFPIAVVPDRDRKIAYFNKEKYSMSTSHHQSYVRSALLGAGFKLELRSTEELQKIAEFGDKEEYQTKLSG